MRKPRTNILFVMTILFVVGVVGQAWLAGKSASATLVGPDHGTGAGPAVPTRGTPLALAKSWDTPAISHSPAIHSPAMLPQQLSDDAIVLVTETCDLQLMAEGTDFKLESSQWSAFAAVVLRYQAMRHTYEAQIANWRVIGPGQYRVEIPMYAEVGDALRDQLFSELCAAFGEGITLEVKAKMGGCLEKHFAGFGVSFQTLDIRADPAAKPSEIQVTRTVNYWNSAEANDRLASRSEIHFPILEDPTGDSWSALLAKVGVANAENGPG